MQWKNLSALWIFEQLNAFVSNENYFINWDWKYDDFFVPENKKQSVLGSWVSSSLKCIFEDSKPILKETYV